LHSVNPNNHTDERKSSQLKPGQQMKHIRNLASLAAILVITSSMSGCLESSDITIFEPGVYQGATDPLIGSSDSAALEARFDKQKDR